jgi:hypothetical protein
MSAAEKTSHHVALVVLGCEVQSVEASGVVNDDPLPDFGTIACFKRIVYWAALRLLSDCPRTRLVVTTLVQEFHDCCLVWCEVVERLTLEADGLVIVREL